MRPLHLPQQKLGIYNILGKFAPLKIFQITETNILPIQKKKTISPNGNNDPVGKNT